MKGLFKKIRQHFHDKKHLRTCHHCNIRGYDYEMKYFCAAHDALGCMAPEWYHHDCYDFLLKCYASAGMPFYEGYFGLLGGDIISKQFEPVDYGKLVDPAIKRKQDHGYNR